METSKESTKYEKAIANVMAILKLDDSGKVNKFFNTCDKVWHKGIVDCKAKIVEKKEELEELEDETLYDAIYKIEVDRIGSTSERKDYVQRYQNGIASVLTKIDNKKDEIEGYKEQIEVYKLYIGLLVK